MNTRDWSPIYVQEWLERRLGPLTPFKHSRIVQASGRAHLHERILDELVAMTAVPGPLLMMAEYERQRRADTERKARTAHRTELHNPHRIWVEGVEYGVDWRNRT